jgi:hypothetical protein
MVGAGVYYVVFGLWAMLHPSSFFGQIATFSPYNAHFLHDAGAFQIGLGLALILVMVLPDAVLAVALAVGAASLLHVLSHVVDINLGGQPARDISALSGLTLVLAAVVVARLVSRPRRRLV